MLRHNAPALQTDDDDSVLRLLGDADAAISADVASTKDKKVASASTAAAVTAPGAPRNGAPKVLFLDGVRGLAAILVVTQHSGFMGDINLGGCAVDTFFVLSAFLLTMLFYKKSEQLVAQQATYRKWGYALADYGCKRFFRVYPLFAITAIALWLLPFESKFRYFFINDPNHFDLFQVLTFEFGHRYHVFWTLPLEIGFYFLIPLIVLAVIGLRKLWWLPLPPLYLWIVHSGLYVYRTHPSRLGPHLPTFLAGSLAAIVYVKLDALIKAHKFEFKAWHMHVIRALELLVLAQLLSVCTRAVLFEWVYTNPVAWAPNVYGLPFVSMLVTPLIVIEMLLPSELARVFEWSLLRYWGKISFSVYLLHSFVIYDDRVRRSSYYTKLFGQFFLIWIVSAASFRLIETPSTTLAVRISKALAERERAGAPAATAKHVPKLDAVVLAV